MIGRSNLHPEKEFTLRSANSQASHQISINIVKIRKTSQVLLNVNVETELETCQIRDEMFLGEYINNADERIQEVKQEAKTESKLDSGKNEQPNKGDYYDQIRLKKEQISQNNYNDFFRSFDKTNFGIKAKKETQNEIIDVEICSNDKKNNNKVKNDNENGNLIQLINKNNSEFSDFDQISLKDSKTNKLTNKKVPELLSSQSRSNNEFRYQENMNKIEINSAKSAYNEFQYSKIQNFEILSQNNIPNFQNGYPNSPREPTKSTDSEFEKTKKQNSLIWENQKDKQIIQVR